MTNLARRAHDFWLKLDGGVTGAAWYWPFDSRNISTAVVIVRGIAHEGRTTSAVSGALAEALAESGHSTLIFDLHGSGQSAGQLDDSAVANHWRQEVRGAVEYVASVGFSRVIVVGIRLGALVALDALVDLPVLGLVCWSPVVSGRRYVQELRLLSHDAPTRANPEAPLSVGGFEIPVSVLSDIRSLDFRVGEYSLATRILIFDDKAELDSEWPDLPANTERLKSCPADSWLFDVGNTLDLPLADITKLTDWCRSTSAGSGSGPALPALEKTRKLNIARKSIIESFVQVGAEGLTGVMSRPEEENSLVNGLTDSAAILLTSTVGPGRFFVNFARAESTLGRTCLRFDFPGFGTSPNQHSAKGGEYYNEHGWRDMASAAEYLRTRTGKKVITLGFCSEAWSVLRAGPLPDLVAVIALNVTFFRQSDRFYPDVVQIVRKWLNPTLPVLARNPLLRDFGLFIRRRFSLKREAVNWLEVLCAAKIPLMLSYSEIDISLEYLKGQLDRGLRKRLHPYFHLNVYSELGHLLEGKTSRTRMASDISSFCQSIDRKNNVQDPASLA